MSYWNESPGEDEKRFIPEGTDGFLYVYRKEDIVAAESFCAVCAEEILGIRSERLPFFGLETLRPCDLAPGQEQGMDCRLISRGRKQADCAAAYTEPCFMPSAGHPWQEEGVLYFLNPEKKLLYKEEIHASDCTTPFPFREAEQPTVELDNTLDIHPYYVRFAGDSRGWLDIVTAERRGSGIITRPVSVKAMHNWAKHARRDDPHLFFARWENG